MEGDRLLLVVLGAGASYDSIQEQNIVDPVWRPPLTKDLFRPEFRGILADHPAAQTAAEAVLHVLANSQNDAPASAGVLESRLAAIQQETATDRTKCQDLEGVRLYLQEVMKRCSEDWLKSNGGVTNHVWLAAEIEAWRAREGHRRIIYCTLNYDTILDQALARRYTWDPRERPALDGYVADQRFALLKLHGSYDWMQRTSLSTRGKSWADVRYDLVDSAGQYDTIDDYRLAPRGTSNSALSDRYTAQIGPFIGSDPSESGELHIWAPALALPMTGKAGFVCPASHLEVLDAAIPLLTGILAIGWRGAEQHFAERLTGVRAGVPFFVVSPHAAETADRLRDRVPAAVQPVSESFSRFRDSEVLADFLGELPSRVRPGAPTPNIT